MAQDEDSRAWANEVRARQRHRRGPQKIADVVNSLMARQGFARVQAAEEERAIWQEIAGDHFTGQTRVGKLRRGVLEINVRNSTVMQELTFQKRQLLERLATLAPDWKVRDLRFRVGVVD